MFERSLMIEFGQCDPVGIVYYPNYFNMFNTSTDLLICAALDIAPGQLMERCGFFGIPMVDARNIYHAPSRYGDRVRITSRITEIRRSSFSVEHQLFTASGALGVEGYEVRVWTGHDPDQPGKPKAMAVPDDIRERLLGF